VQDRERIGFTVLLRRKAELPVELVTGPDTITRGELAERYGADPADVHRVGAVLAAAGITIVDTHPGSRRIRAEGPAHAVAELFDTELSRVRSPHPGTGAAVEHRARSGALSVPAELDGIVVAVLGLDDRPQARSQHRVRGGAPTGKVSYAPPALGTVYKFPANTDGTGQTVAILEFGGGFAQSDLDAYFKGLGIATPTVTAVGVDGGVNTPGKDPSGADGEVLLDIEVIGALVPKAHVIVYFGPNTDQAFADAVSTAVHASPTPASVSISWGQSEDQWTAQARTALDNAMADAAALGVTVTAAAGDQGSGDAQNDGKPHADFPASSPHALACGGTTLRADSSGTVSSETVWNEGATGGSTGGGVSDVFPLPSWQASIGVPKLSGGKTGRGVPDVAANADPDTGYQVLVDGSSMVIGGTSAVAPLWAALTARLCQALGKRLGLLQPLLYQGVQTGAVAPGFRDITSGNNGAYPAGPGWDACTGLGVPIGTDLVTRLGATGTKK
jgi:kumamolisin